MPLSQFREFWAYQKLRNDLPNPAVGRGNEQLIELLLQVFGED